MEAGIMASSMMDEILKQLSGGGMDQIARKTGLPSADVSRAVSGALPAILAGLAGNTTRTPDGAASLASALERDHDGGLLDDVAGFLGTKGVSAGGADILGHVFGGRRDSVESNLGRASGIDGASMAKILALLAPIVMAYLSRQKNARGLDPGGLASMLGQERTQLQRQSPSGMGALTQMLDADGDGSILDDLGGGLLGSLFKTR
jgi:hypothetical protein